jgi:protein-disulfide isomerase
MENNTTNHSQLPAAIILAGLLVAGAILLKGQTPPPSEAKTAPTANQPAAQAPDLSTLNFKPETNTIGDKSAKIEVIAFEDFQCPFCGRFFVDAEPIIKNYVTAGKIRFTYKDFAFLGPESKKAAEAARCAEDQGKFWEYHDYLFNHQNGENQGNFADPKLKSFAKTLNLDQTAFSKCLDTGKYTQVVADSATEGRDAGVQGTPKAFILKDGKVMDTIDGAESGDTVTQKIEAVLK